MARVFFVRDMLSRGADYARRQRQRGMPTWERRRKLRSDPAITRRTPSLERGDNTSRDRALLRSGGELSGPAGAIFSIVDFDGYPECCDLVRQLAGLHGGLG